MSWIGVPINGIRPAKERFVTYSTWNELAELPEIEPFAWVPQITRDDCHKLSLIEIINKYSAEINAEINSSTACYINTENKTIIAENRTDVKMIIIIDVCTTKSLSTASCL